MADEFTAQDAANVIAAAHNAPLQNMAQAQQLSESIRRVTVHFASVFPQQFQIQQPAANTPTPPTGGGTLSAPGIPPSAPSAAKRVAHNGPIPPRRGPKAQPVKETQPAKATTVKVAN
jgi:hypothetical protein